MDEEKREAVGEREEIREGVEDTNARDVERDKAKEGDKVGEREGKEENESR